jgi:hypothetical protein
MIEPLRYAQKAKLKAASLDEVYYDKNPDLLRPDPHVSQLRHYVDSVLKKKN